jgi:dihydrofolate reductase
MKRALSITPRNVPAVSGYTLTILRKDPDGRWRLVPNLRYLERLLAESRESPMADSLNAATKYVATHRPNSLGWGPVEDLGQDIVEGVRRIKAKDGPDLIVWGSSTLIPVLLEHGLADKVLLLVYPILLGTGKRFFSDGAPPRELALVGTKAASSGVVISTYRPSGPLRTGSFDDAAR